jgi:hypothetical protein
MIDAIPFVIVLSEAEKSAWSILWSLMSGYIEKISHAEKVRTVWESIFRGDDWYWVVYRLDGWLHRGCARDRLRGASRPLHVPSEQRRRTHVNSMRPHWQMRQFFRPVPQLDLFQLVKRSEMNIYLCIWRSSGKGVGQIRRGAIFVYVVSGSISYWIESATQLAP